MKHAMAVLLAAALLSSCSAPAEEHETLQIEPVPVQPVVISFTLPFQQDEPVSRCIAALAADYSTQNNVTVAVIYGDLQEEKLLTDLLAEDGTSLYLLPSEYVVSFGGQGYLELLSVQDEKFYPNVESYCSIDGKSFAIPYLGSPMALVWNSEILGAAEVLPPQSWADVLTACKTVALETEKSGLAGIGSQCKSLGDIMLTLIEHSGGKLVMRWGGTDQINIQSKPVRDAVGFYMELLQTDKTEKYAQNDMQRASEVFIAGGTAAAFARPETLRMAQMAGTPVFASSLPENTRGAAEVYGLAIPSGTEEPQRQAALAFAKWLGEAQQLDRVLSAQYEGYEPETLFLLPLNNCAEDLSFYTDHPEYQPFEKQLNFLMEADHTGKLNQIKQDALIPALHAIAAKQYTVDEALAEAQKKGSQMLKN